MAEYTVDAIKKQMDANSAAWFNADAATQEKLHNDNAYLASLLDKNASYDKGAGIWSVNVPSGSVGSAGTAAQSPGVAQSGGAYTTQTNPNKIFPQLPLALNIDSSSPITKDNVSKYAKYGIAAVIILVVVSVFRG